MTRSEPAVYRWSDQREDVLGAVKRRFVNGDDLTLAHMQISPGEDIPGHSHPNEQISWIVAGSVAVALGSEDGERVVLQKDDLIHIPGNVWHKPLPLEDSVVVEVFSPRRSDWEPES